MADGSRQGSRTLPALLAAGGGFLFGVLWMDLLFDVQILGGAAESAVEGITAYYRRATIEAFPMNRMIAAVMLATLAGSVIQLVRGGADRRLAALALVLVAVPVALALLRIVPNAMRLGTGAGAFAERRELARAICFDHLLCAALIVAFVMVEAVQARRN